MNSSSMRTGVRNGAVAVLAMFALAGCGDAASVLLWPWVEFSSDSRLLLSRDFCQGTKLWEVATGQRIDLPEEADTSRVIRSSPEERSRLISLDNTNRVASFAPDGRHLLLLDRAQRRVRTCGIATGTLNGSPIRA